MHYLTIVFGNVSKVYTHTYPALFVTLKYIHLHHFDIETVNVYITRTNGSKYIFNSLIHEEKLITNDSTPKTTFYYFREWPSFRINGCLENSCVNRFIFYRTFPSSAQ